MPLSIHFSDQQMLFRNDRGSIFFGLKKIDKPAEKGRFLADSGFLGRFVGRSFGLLCAYNL
jgi:hypothetical protein